MKKYFWLITLIILLILIGPKVYKYLFNTGEDIGSTIGRELNKNMNNN